MKNSFDFPLISERDSILHFDLWISNEYGDVNDIRRILAFNIGIGVLDMVMKKNLGSLTW